MRTLWACVSWRYRAVYSLPHDLPCIYVRVCMRVFLFVNACACVCKFEYFYVRASASLITKQYLYLSYLIFVDRLQLSISYNSQGIWILICKYTEHDRLSFFRQEI
jgi:hypothetical protein